MRAHHAVVLEQEGSLCARRRRNHLVGMLTPSVEPSALREPCIGTTKARSFPIMHYRYVLSAAVLGALELVSGQGVGDSAAQAACIGFPPGAMKCVRSAIRPSSHTLLFRKRCLQPTPCVQTANAQ